MTALKIGDRVWNQCEPKMGGTVIPAPKNRAASDGWVWVKWDDHQICSEHLGDVTKQD